jgi:4-methylaminobutanoate oxidase (formaldehyde-forming)
VAGCWVAAGFLRARARRGGRRRQGDGRVDRRGIARSTTWPTWTCAASARTSGSARTPAVRALDAYSRYYDVVYPGEEREAGPAAAASPGTTAGCASSAPAFGEKVGLGAGELVRGPTRRRRAGAAPGGLGGARSGRRRSRPSASPRATPRRCSTSPRSPSSTCAGRGPRPRSAGSARNDVDREPGRRLHAAAQRARAASRPTSPSRASPADRFRIVTGTASAGRGPRLDPPPSARRRLRPPWRRHGRARLPLACGGPRAREILQPVAGRRLSHSAFPFLRARPLTVGAVPVLRAADHVRRRARLELYCPAEYGQALWDALWEAGSGSTACVRAATRAIDALRLEKGYRRLGARRDAGDDPGRGRPRLSRCGWTSRRLPRPRRAGGRPASAAARPCACVASCSTSRGRCVSATSPVRVDGESAGRGHLRRLRLRVERSIAYAYLPAAVEPGARVGGGRLRPVDRPRTSVREPLYDPDKRAGAGVYDEGRKAGMSGRREAAPGGPRALDDGAAGGGGARGGGRRDGVADARRREPARRGLARRRADADLPERLRAGGINPRGRARGWSGRRARSRSCTATTGPGRWPAWRRPITRSSSRAGMASASSPSGAATTTGPPASTRCARRARA